MLKAYGLYRKVRNAAWQTLIDNKIDVLPVDVIKIANNNEIGIVKNSEAHELQDGESGLSIFDGADWFIIYDDSLDSIEEKRFIIAHELGHILQGHPLITGYHARQFGTSVPKTESQADDFAIRLLAPACVLWGLNIRTVSDIMSVCKIPVERAKKRAARMRELYKREKFLTSALEEKLFNQFEDYIKANVRQQTD